LFLLLAIVGNPVAETSANDLTQSKNKKVTVGLAQQHTFYLMKEFDVKSGLVTLQRFKHYFHQ
jgi:hypothetical protein